VHQQRAAPARRAALRAPREWDVIVTVPADRKTTIANS